MYFLERWTCSEWFIIKRVIVNENSKFHCDLSTIWEERAWRALTDTLKQRYFFHPGNGYGRLTFVIHRVLIYLKLDNSSCLLLFLPFTWISFFTSFIVISLLHVFDNWEVEVVNDAKVMMIFNSNAKYALDWFWHLRRLSLKQYGLFASFIDSASDK